MTYLDWEDGVSRHAAVLQDRLLRDNAYDTLVSSRDLREIEHLSTNRCVNVVRTVCGRMRLQLAGTEDVFRRADDRTNDRNDEDGGTADTPDDYVESKLLAPCLLDIRTLHAANPSE